VPVDLRVRYPVLLTADAWHLRTKGEWVEETSEAYRECIWAKERRLAEKEEQESKDDGDAPDEIQDEAWIMPDELLPEALLVEEIMAEEDAPEEIGASSRLPGPVYVD
jgi:hypothetical protein